MQNRLWPQSIILVRHGQSAGNVAAELAEANGHTMIDIPTRDVDVLLSDLGRDQAVALGQWIAKWPPSQKPTVILSSPYLRAKETANIALAYFQKKKANIKIRLDERLREREFGIIDRMTKKGITAKYPNQAELYSQIGKFYYRPPGGESWCDVILRLRSLRDTLSIEYAGERVMIVCHSAVILCFRYLLEQMTEEEILTIDQGQMVANCSVTSYKIKNSEFKLEKFNFVSPVVSAGQKVTRQPDVKIKKK